MMVPSRIRPAATTLSRDRLVGAGVDLRPGIGEAAAVERDLRADPPAEAEAAGRVEQIVDAVIAEARRERAR